MKGQTLEEIVRLPIYIRTELDDGAYEEPEITSKSRTAPVDTVFSDKQILQLRQYSEIDRISSISIRDYTYYSTTGSIYARISIDMECESGKKHQIAKHELTGYCSIQVKYAEIKLDMPKQEREK